MPGGPMIDSSLVRVLPGVDVEACRKGSRPLIWSGWVWVIKRVSIPK
jgi:hypothetical protein